MTLQTVSLENFRNIKFATLNLSPSLNIVCGSNGAGKTSLLEALYYSFTNKSFRIKTTSDFIFKAERCSKTATAPANTKIKIQFSVASQLASNDSSRRRPIINKPNSGPIDNALIVVHRGNKGRETLFNRGELKEIKTSDFTFSFPCYYFSPDSLNFISNEPQERRSFIDWLLFHVEPSYKLLHSKFRFVLKSRNLLLAEIKKCKYSKGPKGTDYSDKIRQLDYWDNQFVELCEQLNQVRSLHLERVTSNVLELFTKAFQISELDLLVEFNPGWVGKLRELIDKNREQEIALGYSLNGIHRADLIIKGRDGSRGKFLFSRGQNKMLSFSFVLAASDYIYKIRNKGVLLLLDDLFSELDRLNSELLSGIIGGLREHQIILTSAEESLSFIDKIPVSTSAETKLFHVKHGEFIEENMNVGK